MKPNKSILNYIACSFIISPAIILAQNSQLNDPLYMQNEGVSVLEILERQAREKRSLSKDVMEKQNLVYQNAIKSITDRTLHELHFRGLPTNPDIKHGIQKNSALLYEKSAQDLQILDLLESISGNMSEAGRYAFKNTISHLKKDAKDILLQQSIVKELTRIAHLPAIKKMIHKLKMHSQEFGILYNTAYQDISYGPARWNIEKNSSVSLAIQLSRIIPVAGKHISSTVQKTSTRINNFLNTNPLITATLVPASVITNSINHIKWLSKEGSAERLLYDPEDEINEYLENNKVTIAERENKVVAQFLKNKGRITREIALYGISIVSGLKKLKNNLSLKRIFHTQEGNEVFNKKSTEYRLAQHKAEELYRTDYLKLEEIQGRLRQAIINGIGTSVGDMIAENTIALHNEKNKPKKLTLFSAAVDIKNFFTNNTDTDTLDEDGHKEKKSRRFTYEDYENLAYSDWKYIVSAINGAIVEYSQLDSAVGRVIDMFSAKDTLDALTRMGRDFSNIGGVIDTAYKAIKLIHEKCPTVYAELQNMYPERFDEHGIVMSNDEEEALRAITDKFILKDKASKMVPVRRMRALKSLELGKKLFSQLYAIAGYIEAQTTLSYLYLNQTQKMPWCFSEIIESESPYLSVKNGWSPIIARASIKKNKAIILNDFDSREQSAAENTLTTSIGIITGPNGMGKSTSMRTFAHCAVLTQILGIAPASSCTMTPFEQYITYMNVSDAPDSLLSLFQNEFQLIKKILKLLKTSKVHTFLLIDEPAKGSVPQMTKETVDALLRKLVKTENVIGFVATHCPHAISVAKEFPAIYSLFQVSFNLTTNTQGEVDITPTFKLLKGAAEDWFNDPLLQKAVLRGLGIDELHID